MRFGQPWAAPAPSGHTLLLFKWSIPLFPGPAMPLPIPKKLVVIGDSGVFGWGDPDQGGWCERLRRHWMELPDGPVIYNLGVRGDGLERVAARLPEEVARRGELRRQTPQGILLSVGLNDTARVGRPDGRHQLAPEGFLFGLEQLLPAGPVDRAGDGAGAHPGAGGSDALRRCALVRHGHGAAV